MKKVNGKFFGYILKKDYKEFECKEHLHLVDKDLKKGAEILIEMATYIEHLNLEFIGEGRRNMNDEQIATELYYNIITSANMSLMNYPYKNTIEVNDLVAAILQRLKQYVDLPEEYINPKTDRQKKVYKMIIEIHKRAMPEDDLRSLYE